MTMYRCAKRQVVAILVAPRGNIFVGRNDIKVEQEVCPREEGDGYAACKDVCEQPHHAEVDAVEKAGLFAIGATVTVFGHDHCCEDCMQKMERAGVVSVRVSK